MEPLPKETKLFSSLAQPVLYSQYNNSIAIAHADQRIIFLDTELKVSLMMENTLKDKPWSLKMKENIVMRGGSQGTLSLWDIRDLNCPKTIHTFQSKSTF